MDPAILLMLTVEKRFETRHQEYNGIHDPRCADPHSVEKRFETRHQEYMPRRDQRESVEPARQLERNNLVKRIFGLIRRQQPGECC
jgi:hypothetical protein